MLALRSLRAPCKCGCTILHFVQALYQYMHAHNTQIAISSPSKPFRKCLKLLHTSFSQEQHCTVRAPTIATTLVYFIVNSYPDRKNASWNIITLHVFGSSIKDVMVLYMYQTKYGHLRFGTLVEGCTQLRV